MSSPIGPNRSATSALPELRVLDLIPEAHVSVSFSTIAVFCDSSVFALGPNEEVPKWWKGEEASVGSAPESDFTSGKAVRVPLYHPKHRLFLKGLMRKGEDALRALAMEALAEAGWRKVEFEERGDRTIFLVPPEFIAEYGILSEEPPLDRYVSSQKTDQLIAELRADARRSIGYPELHFGSRMWTDDSVRSETQGFRDKPLSRDTRNALEAALKMTFGSSEVTMKDVFRALEPESDPETEAAIAAILEEAPAGDGEVNGDPPAAVSIEDLISRHKLEAKIRLIKRVRSKLTELQESADKKAYNAASRRFGQIRSHFVNRIIKIVVDEELTPDDTLALLEAADLPLERGVLENITKTEPGKRETPAQLGKKFKISSTSIRAVELKFEWVGHELGWTTTRPRGKPNVKRLKSLMDRPETLTKEIIAEYWLQQKIDLLAEAEAERAELMGIPSEERSSDDKYRLQLASTKRSHASRELLRDVIAAALEVGIRPEDCIPLLEESGLPAERDILINMINEREGLGVEPIDIKAQHGLRIDYAKNRRDDLDALFEREEPSAAVSAVSIEDLISRHKLQAGIQRIKRERSALKRLKETVGAPSYNDESRRFGQIRSRFLSQIIEIVVEEELSHEDTLTLLEEADLPLERGVLEDMTNPNVKERKTPTQLGAEFEIATMSIKTLRDKFANNLLGRVDWQDQHQPVAPDGLELEDQGPEQQRKLIKDFIAIYDLEKDKMTLEDAKTELPRLMRIPKQDQEAEDKRIIRMYKERINRVGKRLLKKSVEAAIDSGMSHENCVLLLDEMGFPAARDILRNRINLNRPSRERPIDIKRVHGLIRTQIEVRAYLIERLFDVAKIPNGQEALQAIMLHPKIAELDAADDSGEFAAWVSEQLALPEIASLISEDPDSAAETILRMREAVLENARPGGSGRGRRGRGRAREWKNRGRLHFNPLGIGMKGIR